jgi:peptidyl-prolyl cis-trans isomerase B (cyclophilin B)
MRLRTIAHVGLPTLVVAGCLLCAGCVQKSAKPYDPEPYRDVQFEAGYNPIVFFETDLGIFHVELWPSVAPKNCQNFVYLVNKGFYDGQILFRVVPGFVIQGGDPLGNGTGGPGYTVPAEFSTSPIEFGSLCMVRWNDDINSAGSQFFIALGRLSSMDRKYTVIGKVHTGYDVIRAIEQVRTQSERPITPIHMKRVAVALWD